MGVNRAIGRLGRLFGVLFALLALRQLAVQVFPTAAVTGSAHDPRTALLGPYRGSIVARDGSPLAQSSAHGRVYPLGRSAAHAVGYVSSRYGESGLEAAFDLDLSPHAVPRSPFDQLLAAFDPRRGKPERGATIVTTLDPVVQSVLATELAHYGRAAGVALDPRTGEVLALASVPSFDPAAIDREFVALNRDDAHSPLLDRALDGLYPPGSTFKIVTAADGLDAGTVTPESTFDDNGAYAIGEYVVHDNEGEATGEQDLTGAFALSSNVDFAQIALGVGRDRWFDDAAKWHLGEPLDFTLPASADRLPKRATVTPGVLAQLGFGQANLLVTPLRMALVAATVAAGGTEPRPYLVRAIRQGGHERTQGAMTAAQPISSETAGRIGVMMTATVVRGTGTAAALPDVTVAGKTGTATNASGIAHAWFVAYAPAEAPRVAVAIVVENGGYGGAVAAPIAKHVLAAALRSHRT